MSTYWGYVCLTHDPPLHSEHWLNHGDDVLTRYLHVRRAGMLDTEAPWSIALVHKGEEYEQPGWWLRQHPHCRIGIGNEYGEIREPEEGAPL